MRKGEKMADILTVYNPETEARELAGLMEAAALAAVADSPDYSRNARAFFAFAAERSLSPAEVGTVRAWLDSLRDHLAPASLVPMLAGVKMALQGAAQELASAKDAAAFSRLYGPLSPQRE
jgi:hypothetical protein